MSQIKPFKICLELLYIALLLIIAISSSSSASDSELPSICKSQCKKSINSTETEKYCSQHADLEIKHRCCVNSFTSSILGIDLQECSQTRADFVKGIVGLSHLVIISLEGNPIKEVKKTDFGNNTKIEYLSLPPNVHCPGGNYSWGSEVNSTSKIVCEDELNPCLPPRNYTCPDDSYCVHVGVNMTNCLCEKGFHGYKCLKEGEFPFVKFGLGISIPTVILCIFLWVTQRRYVKTKPRNT